MNSIIESLVYNQVSSLIVTPVRRQIVDQYNNTIIYKRKTINYWTDYNNSCTLLLAHITAQIAYQIKEEVTTNP